MNQDVYQTILTCRSVRHFTDTPISDDTVTRILQAGRWAGSAKNVQPWHFLVVREAERLNRLAEYGRYASHLRGAATAVVLATLPEERHDLPLHMAAVVLTLAGFEVVFLGPSTPPLEIARAVREHACIAAVLTLSRYAERETAHARLRELRDALDSSVLVAGGGEGLSAPPPGVERVDDFSSLADRLHRHAASRSRRRSR